MRASEESMENQGGDNDAAHLLNGMSREEIAAEAECVEAEIAALRSDLAAKEEWLSLCKQRLANEG